MTIEDLAKKETVISQPDVRAVEFNDCYSRTQVRDAIDTQHLDPAGQVELDWFMDKKNWDTPEAQKLSEGKICFFFFFGAANGNFVPYIYVHGQQFKQDSSRIDWQNDKRNWYADSRALIRNEISSSNSKQ